LNQLTTQPETILDNFPEAVLVVAPEGHLVFLNRAAQTLLGKPGEDLRLEDWPQKLGFFLDDVQTHYPGDKMPLVRALQGSVIDGEMICGRLPTNGIWISMSAKPLEDENGKINGAIALFRDITFRKQIELSREKHAHRNESLYKFSRAIVEAGNDFDKITQVVAHLTSEYIGDTSIVATLKPNSERFTLAAFHHPSTVAQSLLRKYMLSVDSSIDQAL
jgi:hypothetical protein